MLGTVKFKDLTTFRCDFIEELTVILTSSLLLSLSPLHFAQNGLLAVRGLHPANLVFRKLPEQTLIGTDYD